MEADLLRFYGVDLRDLWRGGLTLRRLAVLVDNLPPDSAVWAARNSVEREWAPTQLLLADLFHATTGQPHPARPTPRRGDPGRASSLHARLMAQRARISKESDG